MYAINHIVNHILKMYASNISFSLHKNNLKCRSFQQKRVFKVEKVTLMVRIKNLKKSSAHFRICPTKTKVTGTYIFLTWEFCLNYMLSPASLSTKQELQLGSWQRLPKKQMTLFYNTFDNTKVCKNVWPYLDMIATSSRPGHIHNTKKSPCKFLWWYKVLLGKAFQSTAKVSYETKSKSTLMSKVVSVHLHKISQPADVYASGQPYKIDVFCDTTFKKFSHI